MSELGREYEFLRKKASEQQVSLLKKEAVSANLEMLLHVENIKQAQIDAFTQSLS